MFVGHTQCPVTILNSKIAADVIKAKMLCNEIIPTVGNLGKRDVFHHVLLHYAPHACVSFQLPPVWLGGRWRSRLPYKRAVFHLGTKNTLLYRHPASGMCWPTLFYYHSNNVDSNLKLTWYWSDDYTHSPSDWVKVQHMKQFIPKGCTQRK